MSRRPTTAQAGPSLLGVIISPPELGDEAATESARMFHDIARTTMFLVTIVLSVIVLAQPDGLLRGLTTMLIVDALCVGTLLLNRSGHTRGASWLFVGGIIALLTVNALGAGGIRSPGVQLYFIFVMLAGLLLGERAGILTGVACALIGLLLVLLERQGVVRADPRWGPTALWLLTCVYMGVALMTMRLATQAIRRALGRAEGELGERRRAQLRLDLALDAGEIGVFDHDLRTDLLHADARGRALLGLEASPESGVPLTDWKERVHPDDRDRIAEIVRGFREGKSQGRVHYRIRRPDGTERHLEASAYVTHDDEGAPAVVVGMVMDVSDLLRAQIERERLVRDLGERVKELRLLHDAATLLREQRRFDRDLLDQLVARIPAALLHPDDCRASISYLDLHASSPGWRETPWRLDADFETSSGIGRISVVYLSEHAGAPGAPFLAEERELIESLARLLRSHIEEHTAELQRRELESQLRQAQKMEALGTLAGGIAHDFNNILTAIGGNAELAIEGAPADGSVREHLDEIARAHARARDLVRRILLFSRKQEPERRVIAVAPLVDEALQLIRASLPASITIRTAFGDGVPEISADASQLHQVIMNLATNAAYAMRETGGTLTVATVTEQFTDETHLPSTDLRPGTHVCISVRDTGVGMSEEVLSRLFEPFFTTKGNAGTGLGLAMVHGIVRDHGGAITVESTVGVGTTLRIHLPASEAAATADRAPAGIVRGNGQHILYVDDEESLAWVMSRILARLGYRCTRFTDPHAALQEFRTAPHDFDAVVSDMQMPGMTGLDLARQVRAVRADIPVAIATGYAPEDLARARAGEIETWITKPATLEELSRALHGMLDGR